MLWSTSLSISKVVYGEIGVLATLGTIYFTSGCFGLFRTRLKGFTSATWKNPTLYVRWFFFTFHVAILCAGINMVAKQNMPLLVLCNYLWPTSILLLSVAYAGVKVTRRPAFVIGTFIVLGSLAIEILGPEGFRSSLFAQWHDCAAYLCAIAAAFSWAIYSVVSRQSAERSGGGSALPLFQLTLGLALPLSFVPALHTPWDLSARGGALLALYSCSQFFALICWDYGMRKGSVVGLSLMADFIPWLSLFFTWLLVGVTIESKTIVSAIALVFGAILTRFGTLPARTTVTQPVSE